MPRTLPTCRVGDRERHAVLLSCGRACVAANAAANPCMRQSLGPTVKATPCCLPTCCFCGENDNQMPLTQAQSPAVILKFHSETSGNAESTCGVHPSAVDQVCLLKALTQNSSSDNITLCRSRNPDPVGHRPKTELRQSWSKHRLSRKKPYISECL